MKKIISLLILTACFSCSKKDDVQVLPDGQYKGTFTLSNNNPNANSVDITQPASITFKGKQYSSMGNQNRIPAGGSGYFTFASQDSVKFNDMNLWVADFDWQLILSGTYHFEVKGDSIFLNKTINYQTYLYKLKKENSLNR